MTDLLHWMLVFLREVALLAVFPVFSGTNFPLQLRVALAAVLSFLVAPLVPVAAPAHADFGEWPG